MFTADVLYGTMVLTLMSALHPYWKPKTVHVAL